MLVLALPLTAALSSPPTVTRTAAARAALLNAIAPLERGFKANKQQRLAVESAIKELAASAPLQALPDISGDWELIYTDAPDILGLDAQAGPLVTCTRIGQQISEADGQAAWSECASSQHPVRHLTASEPGPQALSTPWVGGRGQTPRECRREAACTACALGAHPRPPAAWPLVPVRFAPWPLGVRVSWEGRNPRTTPAEAARSLRRPISPPICTQARSPT